MIIQYDIVVTIVNLTDNSTSTFTKTFENEINTTDALLYNNYHVLSKGVYVLDMFEDEVNAYCTSLSIEKSSVEVDEFEIVALTEKADVFFESEDPSDNNLSLKPIIKCYIHPKNDALKVPNLVGVAYDSTTIIWSWPDDEQYAHYLVEEAIDPDTEADQSKIIAQLPIGATSYTETGLEPDTPYTRRLINYTDEQTSSPSPSVTVMTETVEASESLESYSVAKNYDFTTDDSEREIIEERLEAFHSGVGDNNDLKVYKQMDADFYQKFKAYFEITGRRIQREKRYDQVGFNYKICLEAMETIEEQEGEVTFDIDVYPREEITIEDYMWVTDPITVKARMTASVFLRKETEATDTEEIKIYKPDREAVYRDEVVWNETSLIISLDCSTSQRKPVGSGTRRDIMVSAAKKLIDKFEALAPGQLEYVIVGWAGKAHVKKFTPGHAQDAKNSIDTIYVANNIGKYEGVVVDDPDRTNFYAGLTSGLSYCSYTKIGQIFFTDGFCNYYNGTTAYGRNKSGNSACDTVLASVKQGLDNAGCKTYAVLGANWNDTDPDLTGLAQPDNHNFQKEIFTSVQTNAWGYTVSRIDDGNADALADAMANGIDMFETVKVFDHWEFKGWKEQPDDTSIVNTYDIDEVKVVTVTSELFEFTFDASKTPVLYSRKEKRAILPLSSFLPATKLSDKSVYDIIMDAVKQTGEWQAGYNQTIGTIEAEGESDKFLIKGLHVEDTYNFADEDPITEDNWGSATWEDGLEGSVNTYTDIDKAGTTSYGDDCYLVSQDNYFYIEGYTDAIIYDGTRFVTTELNFYDHASEILISASANYNHLLNNRKKKTLTYPGSDPLNHVVDIIEIGKDIFLTGYTGLVKVGDWIQISPLTNDLVAHNETVYESPILNYRFNLEDPDARTPFYEILPTCDPLSEYRNVVIVHIYYARNVWIIDENNYVESFGDDPIATTSSLYIPLVEGLYKYTLKEWQHGVGNENGKYIDEYLWFMAKPMKKTQEYYDELPGPGMDTFYGLVNGRYRSDNQDGKKDLIVDCPQFNIPTTVHKDTIRIYIMITEFYPDTALVSYKWEHPWNNKDSITMVNGDYVTFSSDSLTYKDVEYKDIISTINMENQEIFDNKTQEKIFELVKPQTVYDYVNYYLEVHTDNGDVLALRYPTEITFDENDKANIGVAFKGVVNATSQWAPRIHNGYYYLNQHEYFAYCEFDVKANFDTIEEKNFKQKVGYISIDVQLRHKAKPKEEYSITKDTRSELIQNEEHFQWIDGKGLTLKPFIEGEYYREYETYLYTSPIILFPNTLTEAGKLKVDYFFDDGSKLLQMEVRSYITEEGKWSDWVNFDNDTIPNIPLSCGYQVRFYMQATTWNTDLTIEDYMCCYLDWKDDMNESNTTNIVTITDHMTTGPDDATGIYVSRIIDFGCETSISMDLFDSKYKSDCQLYIAVQGTNPDLLLLENIKWSNITNAKDTVLKGRYLRYKIEIPSGEKVYWLHKYFVTKETHEILPYLTGISMTGVYEPKDIVTNFINTESFEIPTDGQYHMIFNRILDIIGADVLEKGFTEDEIEYVKIQCTTSDITLDYNKNTENQYPGSTLNSGINAMAALDYNIVTKNTPYIFAEHDDYDNEVIIIEGTPQQYCPITIEDQSGNTYTQIYDHDIKWSCGLDCTCGCFMSCKEEYIIETPEKYIELHRNSYELETVKVSINDVELTQDAYKLVNHLLIFNNYLIKGDVVTITYMMPNSFYAKIDRENNLTTLYIYTDQKRKALPLTYDEVTKIKGLTLLQMYKKGKRFSCNPSSTSMNVDKTEEDAWTYDKDKSTFITSVNSSNFNGFVSDDIHVAGYTHEATIKSDNADDDLNGLIVGYEYDDIGEPHTLSFVVTRGGLGLIGYSLIYDFNRATQKILKSYSCSQSIDPSFNTHKNWNEFENGIRLHVEKYNNKVTCKASMWNDTTIWNDNTLIEFDLDSDDDTKIFSKEVYYGYCNYSQAESYYQDIDFQAFTIETIQKKYKVYFETSTRNNKFIANDLSLNPIYRTDYKGFIYLTDEHNEPYSINIYCNPCRLKAGGYDKVDISIEVLDILGNPVISKDIAVDCNCGILNCESYITDMNGVIHLVYESSYYKAEDILTARVLTDDGSLLEKSITIINE